MANPVAALDDSRLYKFLKVILYALLLTPVWVWSMFLFPFITTKILFFRLLVEIALCIYLILALRYPEVRPRWNWLMRAVWIYVAVILIASLFGVNFHRSFFGTVERGEGIVTILHFAAYFTILASTLRSKKEWSRFFLIAIIIITCTALYGFAQLNCNAQISPDQNAFCARLLPTGGDRISATIGNAAFYAAFLIFGAFLSLYLFFSIKKDEPITLPLWLMALFAVVLALLFQLNEAHSFDSFGQLIYFPYFVVYLVVAAAVVFAAGKFTKPFLAAAFFFQLLILFQTQTRGALVAMFVALLVYFLFYIFKSSSKSVKLVSSGLLFFLILSAALIYASRNANWVKQNRTLFRMTTISVNDTTTQSRLDTWQASWKGWKDRFFLGYGYENYNVAFNKYFPARIFKKQGSQIWFDRAHNIFFDVGVTSGLVGLIAYLGIFGAAFGTLWKLFRKNAADLPWQFPLILTVTLLAYFIQNMFVFDTQATYLMFFTFLGFIAFLKNFSDSEDQMPGAGTSYNPGLVFPIILGVIVFTVALFVNFKPAFANYYATQGIKMGALQNYRAVEPAFKHALSYGTYMDQEIRERMVDYVNAAQGSPDLSPQEKAEFYQYATSEIQKSIKEAPQDVKSYLYEMSLLNRYSSDQNALSEVVTLGQKALSLSPTRSQIYVELGQAYFSKKDYPTGLYQFQKAVELNPTTKETRFNYLLAAIISGREGLVASETKYILDILNIHFTEQEYESMAQAYLQAGNNSKAIENYKAALVMNQGSPVLHAQLASIYGQMCDLVNAREQVQAAVQIDNAYAVQGQQFLHELETTCKK
jgi:O-antigen ligase/Tfp pilus assembly protein PilF